MDDGYPIVELDSDVEVGMDSSDDEVDVILHGTPEQKRRLSRQSLGLDSSSEDEFEKEMASELNQKMKTLQGKNPKEPNLSQLGAKTTGTSSEQPTVYDNIYFDSDSDDEGSREAKSNREHKVISNDDLLYDPNIDNENQLWVDRQRRTYQPNAMGVRERRRTPPVRDVTTQGPKPLPHSDAVLNCPACMTVLCLDCQRHDTYKHQYRAMFVMNCDVDDTEILKFPKNQPLSKKKQKKLERKQKRQKVTQNTEGIPETRLADDESGTNSGTQESIDTNEDSFQPVKCSECTTEVGVFDKDEVYHFFNVLAGHG